MASHDSLLCSHDSAVWSCDITVASALSIPLPHHVLPAARWYTCVILSLSVTYTVVNTTVDISGLINASGDNDDSGTNVTRNCSADFYLENNLCLPECGEWEEFPHSIVVAVDVIVILSGIIYFIGFAAVLILSYVWPNRV